MTSRTHRNALDAGHDLLWYRIERILGQGGFGITYLARDANLAQPVAIKEYLPVELAVRDEDSSVHPLSDEHGDGFRWGLDRFMSEARTLARFDHPNIVRVLSVFEANNTAYMVMRYEEGRSLDELLPRRGTLGEGRLRELVFPILEGLEAIHAAGYIHRDIKPANLFVRTDGSAVLLDFGSARQSLGDNERTLTTLVSPGYAPFEQYQRRGGRQGPWTDIYGLGATLYRAVVGAPPLDAVERSNGLLEGEGDPLVLASTAAAETCSPGFLQAIDHALAFREGDRPASIAAWRAELERVDAGPPVIGRSHAVETVEPDDVEPVTRVVAIRGHGVAGLDTVREVEAAPVEGARLSAAGGYPPLVAVYGRVVGSRHRSEYVEQFLRFDRSPARRRAAWSWPAALLTVSWMLYRRMPLWALVGYPLVTVGLCLLALVPIGAATGGDPPGAVALLLLATVAVVWPGVAGRAIYHRRSRRRVARMHARFADDPVAGMAWLERGGGVSPAGAALGVLLTVVPGVLLALSAAHERLVPGWSPAGRTARVERLVAGARQDLDALRLSTPAGRNALEKVLEALALEPGNQDALAVRRAIVEKYVELGTVAVKRGDLDAAELYLERALRIAPDNPLLQRYRHRLEKRLGR